MNTIVVINGAPNTGKDSLAELITLNNHDYQHITFKQSLYESAAKYANLTTNEFYHLMTDRLLKDKPESRLNDLSPRKYIINIAENIIKPYYGKDYFAKQIYNVIIKSNDNYVISDIGFVDELGTIEDVLAQDYKVIFVNLHREGCSFDNDSRETILPTQLKNYHNYIDNTLFCIDINNLGVNQNLLYQDFKHLTSKFNHFN